jgi:hypothetical protein
MKQSGLSGAAQAWEREQQADIARPNEEWRREQVERIRRELPPEKILADAAAGVGDYPGPYVRFSRYATKDELNAVLLRLCNERDAKACLRLLWVFRRVQLPELHPAIWQFAESTNDNVRAAAITALAQCSDPRVGDFGRTVLRSAPSARVVAEALKTLVRNYRPNDEVLIMSALSRIFPTDEDTHKIGFGISGICRENESSNLAGLLRWDYESNPCTLCRSSTVTRMKAIGALSPELVLECLHDANMDIQQLVQEGAPE